MKKSDKIVIILLIISNVIAWLSIYFTEVKKNNIVEVVDDENIKKILDTTYIFDHSKIE
jgi:hypothetical protein